MLSSDCIYHLSLVAQGVVKEGSEWKSEGGLSRWGARGDFLSLAEEVRLFSMGGST